MSHKRGDLLASLVLFVLFAGCAGDGCSCVTPIPGGFPDSERVPNAVQLRVSSTGLAALEADPAGLLSGLVGSGGGLTFDIPSSCGGDPEVCCSGGNPTTPCGPIEIDVTEQPGDAPRLELSPVAGSSQLDVIVRARVKTTNDFGVNAFGLSCLVEIDTTMGGPNADIQLATSVDFVQDADTGTTKIVVGDVTITQFDDGDVSLKPGDFLCLAANWAVGLFMDTLVSTFEDAIKDAITDQVCKQCPSGNASECGPHATACTDGVCMKGGECLQELGITGRMTAASVLGSVSPGTLGAIDIYDVAGGYATTDNGGISLGVLGGAMPAGAERDRCGPTATPPAPVAIPQSSFFAGNTRPDTNAPFDFAFGMHQHHLDLLAYSSYESGFLCLNVSTKTVDLLTSETLATVIFPSFLDLLHGTVSPIVLGLRPQSPPTIALGLNTYRMDGTDRVIDDPLLDVSFTGLEIDFFGLVDDQWIRLMTLVSDVRLPINLDVDGNGTITPVLGDIEQGFTNISVKNSEALLETPTELADKFPALLSFAVPLLADSLGGFDLPALGGLTLKIDPDGITSVDNKSFLAIFGTFELGGTMAAPRVSTEARIAALHVPEQAAFTARRWDRAQRPRIELELGGTVNGIEPGELEWSVRVDRGMWSPYGRSRRLTLSRSAFWLQGRHTLEVRARVIGKPETTDLTPVVLEPIIDRTPPRARFAAPMLDNLFVGGHDNVTGDRVRVEYRFAGEGWRDAGAAPTFVYLDGHEPQAMQIRLTDSSGNQRVTSPVVAFHGSGGAGSGCECTTSDGPSSGGGAMLLLLVALGLVGRRRLAALLPIALVAGAALFVGGCSCGGDKVECFGGECAEGEVEYGPVGRWSDIAVSADRVVVSAYDEGLGDLVLGEVDAEGAITFQPIDGVPDELPVYHPSTYRGGVTQPGPDVGAWTSVALHEGRAYIAYQDRDRKVLKVAYETADGFVIHDVDPGSAGAGGLYASLAIGPSGAPAIAFMAVGIEGSGGVRVAQLRYAQASSPGPGSQSDWTVTILDEAPISCAGLCAPGTECINDAAMSTERCATPSSDCATACGNTQTCSGGTCYETIPNPPAHDLPGGTGLFAQLLHLPDGRPMVVYYDRLLGDLATQVLDGSWTKSSLDAAAETDTGMWATAAVDASGTVHIAYQDALGDRLLYTTWSSGAVGAIEVVDDGTRPPDRAHHVGASASIIIQAGEPAIVYQDGTTSDVHIARRSGGTWQRGDLLSGPNLYGFYISAGSSGSRSLVSSYMYDLAVYPPGELLITTIP